MDKMNMKKIAFISILSLFFTSGITFANAKLFEDDDKTNSKKITTEETNEILEKLDDYLMNCEIESLSNYLGKICVTTKNGEYKEIDFTDIYKDNLSLKEYIKKNHIKSYGYKFSTSSDEEKLDEVEEYYGEEVSDIVKENGFPIKVYSYKDLN